MKVVILEDEVPAGRRLRKLILDYDMDIEVLDILQSAEAGIRWFSENPAPDLIFSDIQLSDDLSFSVFSQIGMKVPVIFTTAYDEYALKTFRYFSIDYLLKPIRFEQLKDAIEKFKLMQAPYLQGREQDREQNREQVQVLQEQVPQPDFSLLLQQLRQKEYKSRFLVYAGDSLLPIQACEVAYIFSEEGASLLMTRAGRRYVISDPLDKLEKELDPALFFRANRQFIVSIHAIRQVHPYFSQKLKLSLLPENKQEVLISKLKAARFKAWLDQ